MSIVDVILQRIKRADFGDPIMPAGQPSNLSDMSSVRPGGQDSMPMARQPGTGAKPPIQQGQPERVPPAKPTPIPFGSATAKLASEIVRSMMQKLAEGGEVPGPAPVQPMAPAPPPAPVIPTPAPMPMAPAVAPAPPPGSVTTGNHPQKPLAVASVKTPAAKRADAPMPGGHLQDRHKKLKKLEKAGGLVDHLIKIAFPYPYMQHPSMQGPTGNPYGNPQGAYNNAFFNNPYRRAMGWGGSPGMLQAPHLSYSGMGGMGPYARPMDYMPGMGGDASRNFMHPPQHTEEELQRSYQQQRQSIEALSGQIDHSTGRPYAPAEIARRLASLNATVTRSLEGMRAGPQPHAGMPPFGQGVPGQRSQFSPGMPGMGMHPGMHPGMGMYPGMSAGYNMGMPPGMGGGYGGPPSPFGGGGYYPGAGGPGAGSVGGAGAPDDTVPAALSRGERRRDDEDTRGDELRRRSDAGTPGGVTREQLDAAQRAMESAATRTTARDTSNSYLGGLINTGGTSSSHIDPVTGQPVRFGTGLSLGTLGSGETLNTGAWGDFERSHRNLQELHRRYTAQQSALAPRIERTTQGAGRAQGQINTAEMEAEEDRRNRRADQQRQRQAQAQVQQSQQQMQQQMQQIHMQGMQRMYGLPPTPSAAPASSPGGAPGAGEGYSPTNLPALPPVASPASPAAPAAPAAPRPPTLAAAPLAPQAAYCGPPTVVDWLVSSMTKRANLPIRLGVHATNVGATSVLGALLGGGIGAATAPTGEVGAGFGRGARRGAMTGAGIGLGSSAGHELSGLGGRVAARRMAGLNAGDVAAIGDEVAGIGGLLGGVGGGVLGYRHGGRDAPAPVQKTAGHNKRTVRYRPSQCGSDTWTITEKLANHIKRAVRPSQRIRAGSPPSSLSSTTVDMPIKGGKPTKSAAAGGGAGIVQAILAKLRSGGGAAGNAMRGAAGTAGKGLALGAGLTAGGAALGGISSAASAPIDYMPEAFMRGARTGAIAGAGAGVGAMTGGMAGKAIGRSPMMGGLAGGGIGGAAGLAAGLRGQGTPPWETGKLPLMERAELNMRRPVAAPPFKMASVRDVLCEVLASRS